MKIFFLLMVLLLVVMEIIAVRVYRNADSQKEQETTPVVEAPSVQNITQSEPATQKSVEAAPVSSVSKETLVQTDEEAVYPRITVEEKNGVTERTIHIGVRQWAWDPSTLRAKQGELVRLIIHNADVRHALVIPELGVEADIPPDGAVVEFMAKRKGTFDFLCATYCGIGHAEMQGKIIVE